MAAFSLQKEEQKLEKMRGLKTKDIYKMSRILKKMNLDLKGLNDELDEGDTKDKAQIKSGAFLIKRIAENIHLAQDEVNDFLGDLVGLSAEEFEELPIEEMLSVMEQFKEQKGIDSFFKLAAK